MAKRRANRAGWTDRLPSGRWRARFAGPDGVRRSAPMTFSAKADAEGWLRSQAKQVDAGTWSVDDKAAFGSFGQYAEMWLEERDLKPRTRDHYRSILDKYLLPRFAEVPLEAITVASVRSWYRSLDLGPTIKSHTYALLRTILQSAYQDDLINANPCRIRGAGSVRRSTSTDVPTAEQVLALADAMGVTRTGETTAPDGSTVAAYKTLAGGKYRMMTLVAAWCGLRFGEVTELRRKDVVRREGVPVKLRVRRAVVRVQGVFVVGPPKSEAGVRDVTIPPHVREDLHKYLENLDSGPDTLLFPGSRTGKHMTPSSLYKPYYRAREAVVLPELRWHDLRHFSATKAAQTGATIAELQARLGHSTTSAAMRYQHAASDSDERIADAMSGLGQ